MSALYHNKGHVDPYKIKQYTGKVLTAGNNSEGGKNVGGFKFNFRNEVTSNIPSGSYKFKRGITSFKSHRYKKK